MAIQSFIPIEDVATLMQAGFICNVHCNGIDLYLAPNDFRGDDRVDYDFALFGYQKHAGKANVGDMARVTWVDLDKRLEELQLKLSKQRTSMGIYEVNDADR
jgi:hypothetical protein